MAESATPVTLFGKWSLDDVEISDLSLTVNAIIYLKDYFSDCLTFRTLSQ
jgi:hypothetical protein